MLKYFKRQKSQRAAAAVENGNDVAAGGAEKRHSLLSTSSFCDEILLAAEDDTQSLQSCGSLSDIIDEDIFNYCSRLSMSITSIVKDTDCMTCFVQYLERKNALNLIKFYLDIENFRIAALAQLAKQQQQQNSLMKIPTTEHTENEALNVHVEETITEPVVNHNVPELKTLCDLSMHKPLTDDEKSQIYAETNKQLTKSNSINSNKLQKKASSQLSLSSNLSIESGNISAASVKDAIAIYQKYLCPNAQLFIELPVTLLSDISLLLCKRHDDEKATTTMLDDNHLSISAFCFDEAQQFVLMELENLYLMDFLQSSYYCKFCLELINNDEKRTENLRIYDILYSEVTLFSLFLEFLEQHGERECLDFWTAAINFRKSYIDIQNETITTQEIQADAMIIYKKFFSLQAEERLWLSDKLRSRVEASICGTPTQIANCFDLALVVTAKYLEKRYFSAFLKSELFAQYVNELKTKIQDQYEDSTSGDVVDANINSLQHKLSFKCKANTTNSKRYHRKTLSDCTHEQIRNIAGVSCGSGSGTEVFKHISQQNTLLAMDTSAMHFKNSSMSIDSRQLTNPNLLWYRRYSTGGDSSGFGGANNGCNGNTGGSGLKFGRVNSLGRYERDFETVESFSNQHSIGKHQWSLGMSGNKIKNAMRKLVNLPEHKAQEEIAWQIAEMIVNDVTSVTLKDSPLIKQKHIVESSSITNLCAESAAVNST